MEARWRRTSTTGGPYPQFHTDRVKDTDFGDIFNLSPIPVLFAQILYGGESHRYW